MLSSTFVITNASVQWWRLSISLTSTVTRFVGTYAQPGEEFDFWELQARAQQLGDLVIAYKCAEDENRWMLNPEHKSKILSWTMTDEVLVLTRPKSTF